MKCLEVFNRCKENKPYSEKLEIYSKKYLNSILKELEYLEEYEKCHFLNQFIKERFDHKKNYLNGSHLHDDIKAISY
jgi:hypothetical protein